MVTTAGSGYVTAPTVTASAGGSAWTAVLGPGVNATVVTFGGTNYVYPPAVIFSPPPTGGVCATGYSTLTGTVVSSITIQNAGAGYSAGAPTITLVNDPRDTTGAGATATCTVAGSGTVMAVICTNHGIPITSGTVPTLAFSSGSAAATALMNWGIQTYAVTAAGAGYGTSVTVDLSAVGPAPPTPAASTAGPDIMQNLVRVRKASIWVPTNAAGGLLVGGQIVDGGVYSGIPSTILEYGTIPTTVGTLTLTMGGFTDTSLIQPA